MDLDQAARRLRLEVERGEQKLPAMREQVAAARRRAEEKARREADQRAEVERQRREEAEAQLDRVHALAVRLDLTLEQADSSTWRVVTYDRGHRLLPGPYDSAAWASVGSNVRGARRVWELWSDDLASVERWLDHHAARDGAA